MLKMTLLARKEKKMTLIYNDGSGKLQLLLLFFIVCVCVCLHMLVCVFLET